MNWEIIGWSSATMLVLILICGVVLMIMSANGMRKQRKNMAELQEKIKVGANVVFAGGFYGKIVKISNDDIDIELSKGVVVQVSRYSIQAVRK